MGNLVGNKMGAWEILENKICRMNNTQEVKRAYYIFLYIIHYWKDSGSMRKKRKK